MAFNLSAASAILKTAFIGPIHEQLNQQSVLWSKILKDSSTQISGKGFTVPIRTGRNLSAGAGRGDGGTLPTAGQQGYNTLVIPNKYNYARIEITGPTIRATRDNAGAFVRAVKSEVDGAASDFIRALNRQFHSDGRDALAFWTATDTTSGTNVDDGQGNAFVHLDTQAMTLDLIDTDFTTKNADSIVVTLGAEGASSYAVTWTGTVSAGDDGDFLVMEDTLGYQKMGIAGIISDDDCVIPEGGGTRTGLHGLAVATYPYWKAQVEGNSGTNRDLTLALMQKPLSKIATRSNFREADVKFLMCNTGVRDKYIDLLIADKRHVNEMELDGGQTAVSFNNKPIIVDPQCQQNKLYYIVPKSMRIMETSEGVSWADFDGSMFSRVANKDAFEAFLTHYGDLAVTSRNANAVLKDISI